MSMIELPRAHSQRFTLSNEVHSRPPEPLTAPISLSCIALTTAWPYSDKDREVVAELTERAGVTPPGRGAKHYSVDLGGYRLVWERHTEFTRYTFLTKANPDEPFASPAAECAPSDWIQSLPGEMIAAINATMIDAPEGDPDYAEIAEKWFAGHALIGSQVTSGSGVALTDFRIHSDGFSRLLILNRSMSPWHAGRIVQRLLEVEVYRVMALLALPVAQSLNPSLLRSEGELSEITAAMSDNGLGNAHALVDRLMDLQSSIEKGVVASQYRFSAAEAYDAIVKSRIGELREERIPGMQTFREFTERRVAPAMNTCQAVAARQRTLSERVDRAGKLLSTRVNMSLERQNGEVLESMNRRAALQLRLQKTVEGLSVAAITYYVIGVFAYFIKGLAKAFPVLNADLVIGLSAPVFLFGVAFALWRMRRALEGDPSVADTPHQDTPHQSDRAKPAGPASEVPSAQHAE